MTLTTFDCLGAIHTVTIVKQGLTIQQNSDLVLLVSKIKPTMSPFLN